MAIQLSPSFDRTRIAHLGTGKQFDLQVLRPVETYAQDSKLLPDFFNILPAEAQYLVLASSKGELLGAWSVSLRPELLEKDEYLFSAVCPGLILFELNAALCDKKSALLTSRVSTASEPRVGEIDFDLFIVFEDLRGYLWLDHVGKGKKYTRLPDLGCNELVAGDLSSAIPEGKESVFCTQHYRFVSQHHCFKEQRICTVSGEASVTNWIDLSAYAQYWAFLNTLNRGHLPEIVFWCQSAKLVNLGEFPGVAAAQALAARAFRADAPFDSVGICVTFDQRITVEKPPNYSETTFLNNAHLVSGDAPMLLEDLAAAVTGREILP